MNLISKRCPFCGHPKITVRKRRGNYRRTGDNYQAVCNKCKARGPLIHDEEEEAAAAWNTRVVSDPYITGGLDNVDD